MNTFTYRYFSAADTESDISVVADSEDAAREAVLARVGMLALPVLEEVGDAR